MTHCPKPDKRINTPSPCGISVIAGGVYAGVDPGLSGAVAFYNATSGEFNAFDTPTRWLTRNGKRRRQIDCVALGTLLDVYTAGQDVHAFVELVNAMPGQGVTSMFSFGRAAGVIDGELGAMGVDPIYVPPRSWQKALGIPVGAGKDAHRALAAKRWPSHAHLFARKKDDGLADASLILAYGLLQDGCVT